MNRQRLSCFGLFFGIALTVWNGSAGPTQALDSEVFPVGGSPTSMVLADLGTGGQFLALTIGGTDQIVVLTTDGIGGLVLGDPIQTNPRPTSLATGDFDQDGDSDIVVTTDPMILTYLGNGAGRFPSSDGVFNGFAPCTAAAVGDFTNDGLADLACYLTGFSAVSTLPGDGVGSFRRFGNYGSSGAVASIGIADVDGDGHSDLALAVSNRNQLQILWGNGSGNFYFGSTSVDVGSLPSSVLIEDFNGDGKPDVALANQSSDDVSIVLGNGSRTLLSAEEFPAGDGPRSLTAADFDGDGFVDLATANGQSDDVSILIGDGTGRFSLPLSYPAGDAPLSLAALDFDHDSLPDLAVANQGSEDVSILLPEPSEVLLYASVLTVLAVLRKRAI